MLAKLIKHEFKATARIFLPILGTVLVLTGAAALTVKLGGILVLPGGTGWGGPVLGLASGLLCWLTFIAMMAMMAAAVGRHHPAVLQKPAGGRGLSDVHAACHTRPAHHGQAGRGHSVDAPFTGAGGAGCRCIDLLYSRRGGKRYDACTLQRGVPRGDGDGPMDGPPAVMLVLFITVQ